MQRTPKSTVVSWKKQVVQPAMLSIAIHGSYLLDYRLHKQLCLHMVNI